MKKELHHVNKVYGNHQLSRYIDVYELSAIDCAATQYSGYKGTEITLIDQTPAGYGFDHWNITGATLTGNNFILNNDVTAQGIYTAIPRQYQLAGHISLYDYNPGVIMTANSAARLSDYFDFMRYNYADYNITTGAINVGLVITAWDNTITPAIVRQHSGFYKSAYYGTVPVLGEKCSAFGLNKEITITAMQIYQDKSIASCEFAISKTNGGNWGTFTELTASETHSNPYSRVYKNINFKVSNNFYLALHDGDRNQYRLSAHFSGYVTT